MLPHPLLWNLCNLLSGIAVLQSSDQSKRMTNPLLLDECAYAASALLGIIAMCPIPVETPANTMVDMLGCSQMFKTPEDRTKINKLLIGDQIPDWIENGLKSELSPLALIMQTVADEEMQKELIQFISMSEMCYNHPMLHQIIKMQETAFYCDGDFNTFMKSEVAKRVKIKGTLNIFLKENEVIRSMRISHPDLKEAKKSIEDMMMPISKIDYIHQIEEKEKREIDVLMSIAHFNNGMDPLISTLKKLAVTEIAMGISCSDVKEAKEDVKTHLNQSAIDKNEEAKRKILIGANRNSSTDAVYGAKCQHFSSNTCTYTMDMGKRPCYLEQGSQISLPQEQVLKEEKDRKRNQQLANINRKKRFKTESADHPIVNSFQGVLFLEFLFSSKFNQIERNDFPPAVIVFFLLASPTASAWDEAADFYAPEFLVSKTIPTSDEIIFPPEMSDGTTQLFLDIQVSLNKKVSLQNSTGEIFIWAYHAIFQKNNFTLIVSEEGKGRYWREICIITNTTIATEIPFTAYASSNMADVHNIRIVTSTGRGECSLKNTAEFLVSKTNPGSDEILLPPEISDGTTQLFLDIQVSLNKKMSSRYSAGEIYIASSFQKNNFTLIVPEEGNGRYWIEICIIENLKGEIDAPFLVKALSTMDDVHDIKIHTSTGRGKCSMKTRMDDSSKSGNSYQLLFWISFPIMMVIIVAFLLYTFRNYSFRTSHSASEYEVEVEMSSSSEMVVNMQQVDDLDEEGADYLLDCLPTSETDAENESLSPELS